MYYYTTDNPSTLAVSRAVPWVKEIEIESALVRTGGDIERAIEDLLAELNLDGSALACSSTSMAVGKQVFEITSSAIKDSTLKSNTTEFVVSHDTGTFISYS